MNGKWINDIKTKAGDYQREAPEGLLDSIKQEMARRQEVMPVPEKHTRVISMSARRWLSAAAVAAIVVGTAYLTLGHHEAIDEMAQQTAISAPAVQNDSPAPAEAQPDQQPQIYTQPQNLISQARIPQMKSAEVPVSADADAEASQLEQPMAEAPSRQPSTSEDSEVGKQQRTEQPSQQNNQSNRNTQSNQKTQLLRQRRSSSGSSLSFGAWCGGMDGDASSASGYYYLNEADPIGPHTYAMSADNVIGRAYNSNSVEEILTNSISSDTEHHHPVRAGISVRYHLGNRWSIGSGVTYSYLSSDFTEISGSITTVRHQKLHYIGIPLNVGYNVWGNRWLNVYVTGGGMAEKLVKGRSEVDGYVSGQQSYDRDHDVRQGGLVYSVNGAAGVEYRATPMLSFYAEPGISYYFDNNSHVQSAYTDKQLNFNLNVGIRFNFNNK